ncbi:MAG: HipA family kinase [Acidiferrobacteraceae bacterium]
MLRHVTAIRFDGRVKSGRTMPCRMGCEAADGAEVDVVAKLSDGCDRKVAALVMEAIAALLAADLDLPIPEPFLVTLEPEFVAGLPDETVAAMARCSSPVAFGSKQLPPGYTSWPSGKAIPREAIATATEIFAFDALIANDDRRTENPNCLFSGASLAIYDHEMAFPSTEGIIGWQPPWKLGSLEYLKQRRRHLFFEQLCGKAVNCDRFARAWRAVTDERLAAYKAALPDEWSSASQHADKALLYIRQVRANIEAALEEVRRVIS